MVYIADFGLRKSNKKEDEHMVRMRKIQRRRKQDRKKMTMFYNNELLLSGMCLRSKSKLATI